MQAGKCTKHYPKRYNESTTLDDEGYTVYRRRNNGASVKKNGVVIDNCYVVPYNHRLLLKNQAHINVEWCNQSKAVKYLFKYINKGNDRVTAGFMSNRIDSVDTLNVDEIQQYYDCRYVSASEASWRIYGNEIHFRYPSVKRLSFPLA